MSSSFDSNIPNHNRFYPNLAMSYGKTFLWCRRQYLLRSCGLFSSSLANLNSASEIFSEKVTVVQP